MARQETRFAAPRLAVVNDVGSPAAPEDVNGNITQPPVAGVFDVYGSVTLLIDVTGAGTATLQPIAWNNKARSWVNVGGTIAYGGTASRFTVLGWASRYAYVTVSAVAGAVNIYQGSIVQGGNS